MSSFLPGDPVRTALNSAKGLADTAFKKGQQLLGMDTSNDPLPTVDSVDLDRYAGKWYELARLPLLFQSDDTVSIAEYSLNDDGTVGVHNISYQGDKSRMHEIHGTATPAKGAEKSNARLKVQFGGFAALAPTPEEGNYWIMRIDDDYELALVGTPNRKYLWLLSKNEYAWGGAQAKEYIDYAKQQGFPVDKLLVDNWATLTTMPYTQP